MIEPRRLREHGASNGERMLLNSARADRPPAGAAQRMVIAMEGLTAGSGGPGAGAPMAAHTNKMGTLAKVGLVALAGLGAVAAVVLAGALVQRMAGTRSATAEMPAVHTPVNQEGATEIAAEPPRVRAIPVPAVAPKPTSPLRGSVNVPRHRELVALDASLSAEIRVLDTARAAVDAHNPTAAQRALDSYAQRFPQGHLKPEAAVLRLAVLVRLGNRQAAKSLAAQLLANESYKAYEARIRSLLRETGE